MAKRSVIGSSKPYERKDKRVEVPVIRVAFKGESYETLDWGLGGFRVADFKAPMNRGEEFIVEGIGAGSEGELMAVQIKAKAVRRKQYELSCSFETLNSQDYDILEALMLRRTKYLESLQKKKK